MSLLTLQQVVTKDGIPLEGLLFEPEGRGRKIAAVWFQGLTGRLSSGPRRTNAVAQSLNKKGVSFAIFDHRGAGVITSFKKRRDGKKKYVLGGTSFEKFENCVLDIHAVVKFLKERGYRKIFLIGHSTGANKVAFYYGKTHDRLVNGLALLGPLNDSLAVKRELGKNYRRALRKARGMIESGRGKELVPLSFTKGSYWGAARFWSNARPGSNEDTFPYYDPKKRFKWAGHIKIPVLVLIGGKDQYADRPIPHIIGVFRKWIPREYFSEGIVKNADHGFSGKEKEMARVVADWISKYS